jgi:glycosyltransferase involved in cell wall biosynthesis
MGKNILYITTKFPSVTHTFIYREIEVLSRAGYSIKAVSMGRPDKSAISREALAFYESTLYLDQISLFKKIFSHLHVFTTKPLEFLKLLVLALREKEVKNLKDKIRILYHFIEAGFLYSHLKAQGLDHIHAHFLAGPTSIALFLSRYLKIPFSFTMHASLIFIDPIMLKTKLLSCKRGITISNYNKKYLAAKYGKEVAHKIDIIHCAIDLQNFQPNNKGKVSPPIVLAVGQLAERKGFRYLLKACQILMQKRLSFQCIIVGDGEEMAQLSKMRESYKITKVVSLLGRQPQERVRDLLDDASIFVLPSIVTEAGGREGIPVALMEAMAMKLPVVSTKTVGIPELIKNGQEGLLVNERNPEQLASAIAFLLKNKEVASEYGERGREKIKKYFNLSYIPKLFHTIFN